MIVVLNTSHPFHKRVYKPLAESDSPEAKAVRAQLDLLLLAVARSEASLGSRSRSDMKRFRKVWSNTLATYLNG
jgi:hypothetical protein